MILALAITLGVVVVLAFLDRRSFRSTEKALIHSLLVRYAPEAAAVFAPPRPAPARKVDEDAPPPGTQPIGLDG